MTLAQPVVLVALTSLAAEGTPRIALTLCRAWLAQGIRPVIVVINGAPRDLAPDFGALGVTQIVLDMPKSGILRYARLALQFFILARRCRAKALLSMPLGWHAVMAVGARLGGVRRVVAHVGNYPDRGTGRAFAKFRALVQLGRPFTDRLVCCSRYVQEGAITHFGVQQAETAVVYNGVLAADFDRREPYSSRPDAKPFTIGMVARLEKHKDHDTLIHAARILKDRGRTIVVDLVGDGSQRNRLQDLIDTTGLSDTVRLLGMRRNVQEILADLDLFVFSTTPDEGFGIALVEAMLAGVSVVASDVGACREVLDGGRLGLLVPPADRFALADAIDAVMSAPDEARIRASLARAEADKFSAAAMARAYGNFLGLPSPAQLDADARPVGALA